MSNLFNINKPVEELRALLDRQKFNPDLDFLDIISHREEVLSRFQPMFTPEAIKHISADDFKSFLIYKNNHHWGLQRQGGNITRNMPLLRRALSILVDETIPINDRLNRLKVSYTSADGAMVPGSGISYLTGILLFAHPDKYGVWNKTTMDGMEQVGLWDDRWMNDKTGNTYLRMLNIFGRIAGELKIDFWTLDALWWVVKKEE